MTAFAVRRRTRFAPPEILAAIALAWALAGAAQALGGAGYLHHDKLIEGDLPLWAAVGLFLLAWQAMIAAMMLPSSLPLMRLFAVASASSPDGARARTAFLAGYAAVWSAFGYVAFLGDVLVHDLVHRTPLLEQRPWFVAGGALLLAGGFQFSPLKHACLRQCRHPAAFLLRNYRRGVREGFRIGRRHGLYCLGCCWALMLIGFASGVASLWWMAALTLIMVFEKTSPDGDRGAQPLGVALIALGLLVLAHPDWLPSALAFQSE